jgi:hypothetical protein
MINNTQCTSNYLKNDKLKSKKKSYYLNNKEKKLKYSSEYNKNNSEKIKLLKKSKLKKWIGC